MNFVHWMRRIHRPTARTHSIGCGWGNAGSSHHSGPPLPSPCPKTNASPLILVAKTIMLLPLTTKSTLRLPTASNGVASSDPASSFWYTTEEPSRPSSRLDGGNRCTDDQRQMSRSGAAERYRRTREGLQLR